MKFPNEKEAGFFFRHCKQYYGIGGLYDLGATDEQIAQAIEKAEPAWGEYLGDHCDRFQVKKILEGKAN